MPDASGGIASGLYWIATGKMPMDDLEDDEEGDKEGGKGTDNQDTPKDLNSQKARKGR